MSGIVQDELWPHFAPLWTDLRTIAPQLLLAGGYGLFLKQQWLVSQWRFLGTGDGDSVVTPQGEKLIVEEVRTLVSIDRWNDQTPRVTKDFDFIASLDLIAGRHEQPHLDAALKKHGFQVVQQNARWQFRKEIDSTRSVILDFHAPSPSAERNDLRVESRRIKPKPSMGDRGIHGRENQEAIVSALHPFLFTCDGVEIALPNSVTLALMKLAAMRDRRNASQDESKSTSARPLEDAQAKKHAEDVCRVMAMVTKEESECARGVLDGLHESDVLAAARSIFKEYFETDEGWGSQVVAGKWQDDDFRLIQKTLGIWLH